MTPAQAHDDSWRATVAERDRKLDYSNLHRLIQTCDFEGKVTWVLGVGNPRPYRVVELSNPPHLVVDVKQK